MSKLVLVVDDDCMIREAVMEVLGVAGHRVVGDCNGREALSLLCDERLSPDVIVLDLMMPVMNGWQFREAQLADPRLAEIPVVVMSAMDARGLSASALLSKPFDIDALVGTVSTVGLARRVAA